MFYKINIVERVKSYILMENKIPVCIKENKILFLANNYIHSFEANEKLEKINYTDQTLFVTTMSGNSYYYENKNFISINGLIKYCNHSKFCLFSKKKNSVKDTYVLNFSLKTIYKINGSSTIDYIDEKIYFRKNFEKKSIQSFTLPQSVMLWEFSAKELNTPKSDEYEIIKLIGTYRKQLLIILNPTLIICLDIVSGNLTNTFNIQDSFPTLIDFQKDTFSTSYHLDEINNRLIILSYTTLFHINLITKEVKLIKDYHNLPQQEQWRFMSATLFKDKIYFTGDLGLEYVVATRVGVMNVETGEILWQQQLQKTGGLPNAPQVTEDKLYVHTVNGQLYIYDSEENIS